MSQIRTGVAARPKMTHAAGKTIPFEILEYPSAG